MLSKMYGNYGTNLIYI
jgi:serine/threonine protein kinase